MGSNSALSKCRSIVGLLLFISFFPPFSPASAAPTIAARSLHQKSDDLAKLRASVQAKLDDLHANAGFPGATVAFILSDGRYAAVSTGLADVENRVPLSPGNRMLAGSIGKTFVAAVVMQLAQEGKINIDDKLSTWLGNEAWFSRLPNADRVTLRNLMNHASGIQEYFTQKNFPAALREKPDKIWRPEELVDFVLDLKPLFPAGKGFSYADTNYILVGMVVERVTKRTLYTEVEQRILKPLKLTETIPSNSRTIPGLITGYSLPNSPFGFSGRTIIDGRFVINPQFEWAGGGFASTPLGLARWAKALYEGKAFGKPWLDQMLDGVEAKEGRGAVGKYGFAVQIRQSGWGPIYGHGGWFPGYLSEMEYFPKYKVAIAIQTNTDDSRMLKKGLAAYVADMAHIILGEPSAAQ